MQMKTKETRGITLIALVVTIILLLIFAGISVSLLAENSGIMRNAEDAAVKTIHTSLYEAIDMEAGEYTIGKNTGEYDQTLVEYLKAKGYIYQIEEVEGYVINAEKLIGKSSFGNGIDGKTDVYKMEEIGQESASINKVASLTQIQIAENEKKEIKYKVVYYGKEGAEGILLGYLSDTIEGNNGTADEEIIHFSIKEHPLFEGGRYVAKKGMTWSEWINSEWNTIPLEFGENESYVMYGAFHLVEWWTSEPYKWKEVKPTDMIIDEWTYELFQDRECVFPDSKILVSEVGDAIDARCLKEGDNIAYYDFEQNKVEIGKVAKAYIHPKATNFVRYEFEDGTYLEATDYHPIYTKQGWKSLTRRNGYEVPEIGDEVKNEKGWKKLVKIEEFTGVEDCYDFAIETMDGKIINNYFANGTLVQGSY